MTVGKEMSEDGEGRLPNISIDAVLHVDETTANAVLCISKKKSMKSENKELLVELQ